MASLRIVSVALLCTSALSHATHAQGALRHNGATEESQELGLVRPLEFDHRLRVCNVFPAASSMDVYRGKDRLTGSTPMPYKDCRDFHAQLRDGDKLEFKLGDTGTGTFSVSDLPSNDAVLLLVVHRHDTLSTAVSFESHVFANLKNAQVAVIDAYRGSRHSTPKIMDGPGPGRASRSEELRYDSVVAVNPGVYELELGTSASRAELVALHHESYVVMRAGVEAQRGASYPEELIVYPRSEVVALRSGAAQQTPWVMLALAVAALAF